MGNIKSMKLRGNTKKEETLEKGKLESGWWEDASWEERQPL